MLAGFGWTGFDGLAEALVAFGTILLAGFTWRLARRTTELASETKDLARETKDEAKAAAREAAATENLAVEARTDRQLQWQPKLERLDVHHRDVAGVDLLFVSVRNSGVGPALNVVVTTRDIADVGRWWLLRCGDLRGAEEFRGSEGRWPRGSTLTAVFEGFPDCDRRRTVTFVMLCTDVLGRRFRFGIAEPTKPYPGEPPKVLAADISALSANHPQHTGWADNPLIWG